MKSLYNTHRISIPVKGHATLYIIDIKISGALSQVLFHFLPF